MQHRRAVEVLQRQADRLRRLVQERPVQAGTSPGQARQSIIDLRFVGHAEAVGRLFDFGQGTELAEQLPAGYRRSCGR